MAGLEPSMPLAGMRVIELSSGIAGGYCTKLLVDAGADVVKVEDSDGDWLRRWRASGEPVPDLPHGGGGALFQFLAASKRSVVADPDHPADRRRVLALIDDADAVVWSPGSAVAAVSELAPARLTERRPELPVLAITNFGLTGPWAGAPATEFTLQAWSGGVGQRGASDRPPVSVGGRSGEWAAGLTGAVALLTAHHLRDRGIGGLLDCSILEALVMTHTMYTTTYRSVAGQPARERRSLLFPGVERTRDGWVALTVATGQQWLDFATMVEQYEWLEDESLGLFVNRVYRRDELGPPVSAWMGARTTAEVIEVATAFRIPVAPVCNGATVTEVEQFRARRSYVENPGGGFRQPAVPYTLGGGATVRAPGVAPRLGEHADVGPRPDRPADAARPASAPPGADALPLAGLRVVEFTGFWAGPMPGHYLAHLGADVIHVEAPRRLDGMRYSMTRPLSDPHWCEYSGSFHGGNCDKRSLTLDLDDPRGHALALQLISISDVVVENFSPRVMEHWGFDYERLAAGHPELIMLRAPAYGLEGPWRDRVGYAQTIESVSGMTWLTGFPDDDPQMPNGPCDPIAGSHATFALLLALEHRRRTGLGMLVEAPTVGGVLNVVAEPVLEYSAYGLRLDRLGNRSATAAPQNVYLSADVDADGRRDRWVAIAVETESQWVALCDVLDRPHWLSELGTLPLRRARVEEIDAVLGSWCGSRPADGIVATLWARGVPAATVLMPHEQDRIPQLGARGFFETLEHPVVGEVLYPGHPVRHAWRRGPLHRTPAPTFGQHNREILVDLLGLTDADVSALGADHVIASAPLR